MKREIRFIFCFLALVLGMSACAPSKNDPETPRNLIYMIGDGMGLSHVAMMMIEGGYDKTAFDRMENVALITTYSANNRVTDSAAAGTALAAGTKTNNGMLGMTPDSLPVESLIARAVKQGRSTGIVVTCEIQHATPGSFYAHVPFRGEYDAISQQLAQSGVEVILGGGRAAMTVSDPDNPEALTPLARMEKEGYRLINNLDELDSMASGLIVGLLAEGHLPSKMAGRGDYLPRAVEKSLQILTRNVAEHSSSVDESEGFVLVVEASQIDFESHGNNAPGILAEVRDFDEAIAAAMRYVDAHPDTLLVVTADHETGGLTMPSGNSDFTASESGVEYRFSTGSHTAIPVPVYLYGCGAERINGVMDNTELSRKLAELMHL